MGTAFAGIVRTPLTSVIMIFEMTRDDSIIVPLIISNLIAFFISQGFQHEPIYEALASQEGVHLPTAELRSHRGKTQIVSVMRSASDKLPEDAGVAFVEDLLNADAKFPHVHADHPLSLALERMGTAKLRVLPVVSRANVHELLGIVTLQDMLDSYGVGRRAADGDYSE